MPACCAHVRMCWYQLPGASSRISSWSAPDSTPRNGILWVRPTARLKGLEGSPNCARKLCQGRLLLGLEGGYDAAALASCMGAVATNLLDAADDSSSGSLQGMLEACQSSQEPLAESMKAIWATRMAHQTLPLRLMDGSSAALVPFSRTKRKYEASKNLNAETLLGQLKSKRSSAGG